MAPGDRPAVAWLRAACALGAAAVLMGCPPRAPSSDAPAPDGLAESEAAREAQLARARDWFAPIVAAHDARVALLEVFEAPAATVLRYPDGDRIQEDQLDGFIYLSTRGRGAFELRLLGKTWAWLGGDGARSWIYFAPPNEPSRMHVYERAAEATRGERTSAVGAAELTLLTPASLRFLLGLAPIAGEWSPVERGGAESATSIADRFEVRWSPTDATVATMRFGPDGLAAHVRVADREGVEIARANLSEFKPVSRDGLAIGAWPRTATRVLIEAPRSKAQASLTLDGEALERRKPRARERFFNLDELRLSLAPAEIILHDGTEVVRPAGPLPSTPKGH